MTTPPTPAQPAEGAVICRLRDVPEGWQWRHCDADDMWVDGTTCGLHPGSLVEARPVPEPTVTIELPLSVVKAWKAIWGWDPLTRAVTDACRRALEGLEVER